MVGIGVIGYGYWGPNLVRNFAEAPGGKVVAVSDLSADRLALAGKRYPAIATTSDYREVLNNPAVDAVAIATPVHTHYRFAMDALQAGKHVLVEKPLASTSEEASRLIDEAEKRKLLLMVDHTFVYTGAVRKIRELIAGDALGQIYYYDSVRVNLGLFQSDVNVLWDLAVHDLSIMDFLLGKQPAAVSATGISHVPGRPENIAYLTLFFDNNMVAHIHANWLAPVKVRQTLIGASQKMIVYDDLDPNVKVKVYDKGISVHNKEEMYQMLISYRAGDMWAPKHDATEALQVEAAHFIRCVEGQEKPVTDGHAGLRVVKMLEAANESMQQRGSPVEFARARGAAWSR